MAVKSWCLENNANEKRFIAGNVVYGKKLTKRATVRLAAATFATIPPSVMYVEDHGSF